MLDNLFFNVIFLSQLLLLSHYYPGQILKRMDHVLEKYPPSSHPKLYPKSLEYELKGQRNFRRMNQGILILGLLLLVFLAVTDYPAEKNLSREIPVFFGMFQFLPMMLMEISGFQQFKLMRKADTRSVRSADIQSRRLSDFVPPLLIALTISAYALSILFDFYVHQFDISWGHDTVQRSIVLTAGNILMGAIIFFNIRGKKLNPHQAHKDRLVQIKITARSIALVSILASVFLMTVSGADKFDLEPYEASMSSLYIQALAVIGIGSVLQIMQSSNANFDVYRADELVRE